MEYLSVSEVAEILGISRARVHQLIQEPCRECGKIQYTSEAIEYIFNDEGCSECRWTGMRLPTDGRFGDSDTSPYRIRMEDAERERERNRKPGYPKGRKRITR